MGDGRSKLSFNVVTDDRQAALFEFSRPDRVAGDENRNVVDKSHTRIKCALRIKPGGRFGPDRKIVEQHVGIALPEDPHHVLGGAFRCAAFDKGPLRVEIDHVRRNTVKNGPHGYFNARWLKIATENLRTVWRSEHRFAYLFSHFTLVDIESRHHLDIGGTIPPDIPMHEPDGILRFLITVKREPLNKGTRTVSHPDDCDFNLLHRSVSCKMPI